MVGNMWRSYSNQYGFLDSVLSGSCNIPGRADAAAARKRIRLSFKSIANVMILKVCRKRKLISEIWISGSAHGQQYIYLTG